MGEEKVVLDSYDTYILSALLSNSRVSLREIARRLKISVSTVHERIKKLKAKGVLKAFTVLLDYNKLGYDVTALIMMKVDGKHIVDVEQYLAREKNVLCVYDITGVYDVAVIARFKEISELNKFIKRILKHPHIQRTNTSIVFNVVKEDFRLQIA